MRIGRVLLSQFYHSDSSADIPDTRLKLARAEDDGRSTTTSCLRGEWRPSSQILTRSGKSQGGPRYDYIAALSGSQSTKKTLDEIHMRFCSSHLRRHPRCRATNRKRVNSGLGWRDGQAEVLAVLKYHLFQAAD